MPGWLLVQIGATRYGLDLEALQEVVAAPRLHPVPGGNAVLPGAINLHGQILPVIDVPELLGAGGGARDPRLVVLSPAFHQLALCVTGVGRIIPRPPPPVDAGQPAALDPARLVACLERLYAR